MLAYTDSLEASQKRYQNALEKFALAIDRTEIVKKFYDSITFLANNAVALGTALTTVLLLVRGKEITEFLSSGVASLAVRAMNFGTKLTELSNSIGNGSVFKKAFSNVGESMRSVYESNLKEKYAIQLRNTKSGILSETEQGEWLNIQDAFVFSGTNLKDSAQALTDMLGVYEHEFEDTDAIKQLRDKQRALGDTIASYDSELNNLWLRSANGEDIDEAKYQETLNNMTKAQEESTKVEQEITALKKQQQQQAVAEILNNEQYSTIRTQLLSTHQSEIDTRVKEIMQENQLEYTTENLANARRQAERETLETVLSENNLNNANRTLDQRRKEPGVGASTFVGLATIAGGSLGGLGLGNLGKQLFGDKGQVFGSLIGGIAGTNFSSTFATAITKIGTAGFKAALSSPGVIGAGIGLATIIGMSIFGWIEKSKKEKIEQQAKEFQTESDKYQSMLNASVDASKLKELSKGVDRLGRNVNLTDDEYEEFLNLNTKLAEQFPGLIKFTDGQGQAFVGAADGANSLSESIDNLIKQQQKLADEKLLAPELFDQTYKDAKKQYDEIKKELENAKKNSQLNSSINFSNEQSIYRNDYNGTEVYAGRGRLLTPADGNYNDLAKRLDEAGIDYISTSHEKNEYGELRETIIDSISIKEEVYQKEIDKLKDFTAQYSYELLGLESELESSKHALDEQVNAIFRLLSYNDTAREINPNFDVNAFNKLDDTYKTIIRDAISGIDLTSYSGDSFKKQVSNYVQQLQEALNSDKNDLILKFAYELDETLTAEEFNKGRKDLLKFVQRIFGEDSDITKTLLLRWGWAYDENNELYDTKDILSKIESDGLTDKIQFANGGNLRNSKLALLNVEDLNRAYSVLKGTLDDVVYTEDELLRKVMYEKYNEMGAREVARSYEDMIDYMEELGETYDNLSESDKQTYDAIIENLRKWAKALDIPEEKIDAIISKIKQIPDVLPDGTVETSPRDVYDDAKTLQGFADYMNKDFKGSWDADTLTEFIDFASEREDYQYLLEFIKNDAQELTNELNRLVDSQDERLDRSIAHRLASSKAGSEALIGMHKNEVDAIKQQYGIDLSNFENLNFSKDEAQRAMVEYLLSSTAQGVDELPIAYQKDLENFGNATSQKIKILGIFKNAFDWMAKQANALKSFVSSKSGLAGVLENTGAGFLGATLGKLSDVGNALITDELLSDKTVEDFMNQVNEVKRVDFKYSNLGSDKSGSGSDNKFKEQPQNALDILKNYRNLIDKEWEAMIAWDEDKQIDYGTKYFEKMRENLSGQISATQAIMNEWNTKGKKIGKDGSITYWDVDSGEQITQKEFMDQINTYKADLIELQKELNNLDDEELQDAMNLMETKKAIADLEDERLGVYENYNRYLSKSEQSYRRQKENLEQQLYIARQMLNSTNDTEEEHYANLQKVKELERQIADLDYEEQEHRISILESVDASVYALIDAQKVLLENARTQEEMIEGQNKLNDLLEQERELRKSIFDFQRQNAERSNQYYSGTAYSDSDRYNSNYELQVQSIEAMKNIAQEKMEDEFRKAYKQYITELDEVTGARKWTDDEAYEMAGQTEEYMSAYNEWFEFSQQIADLAVQKMQDQLAELDSMLDRAERAKPDDWSYYEQISEYSNEQLDILQKKKALLEESLQDVSTWTDEQIKQATDELNNVVEAINDALINTKQEQINYQDRQFDALISYLEREREKYSELKQEVEDYYDGLLKPLEQEIDDLDKVNELLQLQNALKAAGEKSRVYRQGLGWVYEADHVKRKKAQQDLDNFYRDLKKQDLEDTKNKELQDLDDMIDNWDKYIESIKYRHSEFERLEEERLIKQLLNASNMEEVNNKILNDYNHFITELDGDYKAYDGIFTNFLDDYRDNNIELQKLQQQRLDLLNPDNYLHQNDYQEEPDTNFDVIDINQAVEDAETKQHDMDLIKLAGKGYAQAAEQGNYDLAALWHDFAEDIRAKYGYSGGEDGSKKILLSDAQIKDLEQMVTYEGKTMTKREANLRKHGNLIGNYFSQQDTQAKDYYAKEMSNVLMHESNTIKEAGLNEDLVANWISYNRNTQVQYDLQNMNFSDFIDKYADELDRYKKLVDEMMITGDYANSFDAAEDLGNVSFGIVNGNKETLVLSRDGTYMTKADADRLEYLGKNWQNYSGSYSSAHAEADEIRRKYGYTTDAEGNPGSITQVDKDKWNATQNYKNTSYTSNKNTGSGSSSSGSSNKGSSSGSSNKGPSSSSSTKYSDGKGGYISGSAIGQTGKTIAEEVASGVRSEDDLSWLGLDQYGKPKSGRANGIEGGPVTYTGLTMLHGTPTEPEYVLNNDQAYNMLYNLSRNRMPEFSSNLSGLSQGTVYTLNGDIIIDGATDPKKFWSEVTKNMNIRSNVTKNK